MPSSDRKPAARRSEHAYCLARNPRLASCSRTDDRGRARWTGRGVATRHRACPHPIGNLLLVDPNTLTASPETHAWLVAHVPTTVVALGGPDVVSPLDTAHALIRSETCCSSIRTRLLPRPKPTLG